MNHFWKSDTYAIVKALKANGNRPGLIQQWKDAVEAWATSPENVNSPDAKAVVTWLPAWQARPFYTARELVPLWPMLAVAVGWSDRPPHNTRSVHRLENELLFADLPRFVKNAKNYFIVEKVHYWKSQVILGNWKEINDALSK